MLPSTPGFAAAPSTTLRVVPLPRFAGEEPELVDPPTATTDSADAPPFTGELSAKPTEGAATLLEPAAIGIETSPCARRP